MNLKKIIEERIKERGLSYFSNLPFKEILKIKVKRFRQSLISTPYSDAQFIAEVTFKLKNNKEIQKKIFIKKFKNAEQEYNNFKKIKKITSGPLKMAPFYYDFLKEENLIFVEYIYPAKNLLYEFLKNNIVFHNIDYSKNLMRKIACWLTSFQSQFNLGENKDFSYFLALTKKELTKIPYFSFSEKEKLIAIIKKEAIKIKKIPLVYSADLYLRHLLLYQDRLILVDWDNLKITHPYYDIHALFINLESRTRHPFFFSLRYIKKLEDEFLKTYKAKSSFDFSEKIYKITRLMYLIHFLYSYYWRYRKKIFHPKKMIFWRFFIYNIKKEVKNYLIEDEF